MSRSFKVIGVLVVLAAGGGIFQLKYTIEVKDRELRQLEAKYVSDQKTIRVLEAEWAYLNSPAYLQDLSVRYLGLRPSSSNQVLNDLEKLPWRNDLTKLIIPKVDFVVPTPREKPYFDYNVAVTDYSFEPLELLQDSLEKMSADGGSK
ncbi:MAG: cell division protein FtsL [Sphingomonadales bacterium]|jgi:hypothetical protein